MKPITYEIKRTLTSKFVIIMIFAIVGLSTLIAYENGSTYSPVSISTTPQMTYGYYVNGTSLTMVGYAHNSYGQPLSKITASYTYNGNTNTATSGKDGYANSTFTINPAKVTFVNATYSYSLLKRTVSGPTASYAISGKDKFSGLILEQNIIHNTSNDTRLGLQFMYVGANGTSSPSYNFYVGQIQNYTSLTTNYSFKTTETGFRIYDLFPSISYNQAKNKTFVVEVTNSTSGAVLIPPPQEALFLTVYAPITQSELQSLVFSGTSQLLGILIPILAIFTGYLTYGKDRTSGVLESVLKRPVTRGSLIASRFSSNATAIFFAVGLSMVISDLIINHYFGLYLSLSFSLYFVWTYFVEGVAFLAMIYMFSHVVKSQGAILGISIALFVVLDLFWAIIPLAILSALGISSASTMYIQTSIAFDFASPSGYGTLVQTMFTNQFGILRSLTIDPNAFGIDGVNLIIAGIVWMAVPFLVAFLLAKNRD